MKESCQKKFLSTNKEMVEEKDKRMRIENESLGNYCFLNN